MYENTNYFDGFNIFYNNDKKRTYFFNYNTCNVILQCIITEFKMHKTSQHIKTDATLKTCEIVLYKKLTDS